VKTRRNNRERVVEQVRLLATAPTDEIRSWDEIRCWYAISALRTLLDLDCMLRNTEECVMEETELWASFQEVVAKINQPVLQEVTATVNKHMEALNTELQKVRNNSPT